MFPVHPYIGYMYMYYVPAPVLHFMRQTENTALFSRYFSSPVQCHRLTGPHTYELRHDKTNKTSVRPAKTQMSLGIRPVWSESSQCAQWVAEDPRFLHADSEDSDQTGRMPRLIWAFAGRTAMLLVLSCRGSYNKQNPRILSFILRQMYREVIIHEWTSKYWCTLSKPVFNQPHAYNHTTIICTRFLCRCLPNYFNRAVELASI